ncbi:MAG: hypothetical protein LUF27_01720 [Lachnospiraceae bacterium]|nr:hypothetical protein [Lachnospiraceae bacterium]
MAKCYVYKVIRENVVTGEQGKRPKKCWRFEPLKVGGLYCHLGDGFPGFQRVLELVEIKEFED